MDRQTIGLIGAALCLLIAREFWKMYKRQVEFDKVARLIKHL
jgi:hypothetical protein